VLDGRNVGLAELVARRPERRLGRLGEGDRPDPLPAHVGVWLDRIVALETPERGRRGQSGEEAARGNPERLRLYQVAVEALRPGATEVSDPPAVAGYRPFFARWRRRLEADEPGIVRKLVAIEARSRILLHSATHETVTEGSVLLHHPYGVPYLPGSGLKGVLRHRLERDHPAEEEGRGLADELLGRQDRKLGDLASVVDLLDALWVPERPPALSPEWSPLALDVVTPHHPSYYTAPSGQRRRPTDFDEPTPVHRLTVAPGARFLLVAEAADTQGAREWLDELLDSYLLPALEEDGFGAWTSVGYGRLGIVGGTGRQRRRLTPPGTRPWYSATRATASSRPLSRTAARRSRQAPPLPSSSKACRWRSRRGFAARRRRRDSKCRWNRSVQAGRSWP
jgi:CRISPR-associated protein Cmr6